MSEDQIVSEPRVCMLTTTDNPWDPFTEWQEWFAFDLVHGYNTPGLLARVAKFSLEVSDADQDVLIAAAIDEIVRENPLGIYTKAFGKPE
jgi:hypothetical protein